MAKTTDELEDEALQLTEEEQRKIQYLRSEYEKRALYVVDHQPDKFFEKTKDDHIDGHIRHFTNKRKVWTEAEMRMKSYSEVEEDYRGKYRHFCDEFSIREQQRFLGYKLLRKMDVMQEFLMEKDPETGSSENVKVRNIRQWGMLGLDHNKEDKLRTRKEHEEKLDRYRRRKPWEAWCEEDELDIEGERILSEIKNYKAEHFFQMR